MTPRHARHARRHEGLATAVLYACGLVIVGAIAEVTFDPKQGWIGVALFVAALLTGMGCWRYLGRSPDSDGEGERP